MSLIIALPSKGRLKEQAEEFFAAHGFKVKTKGGNRD
jgi:ATP phosphoribosyltransferase